MKNGFSNQKSSPHLRLYLISRGREIVGGVRNKKKKVGKRAGPKVDGVDMDGLKNG